MQMCTGSTGKCLGKPNMDRATREVLAFYLRNCDLEVEGSPTMQTLISPPNIMANRDDILLNNRRAYTYAYIEPMYGR